MIVLGIILILLVALFPTVPPILTTIGIILVVVGTILAVLGATGHPVGGRRYWY